MTSSSQDTRSQHSTQSSIYSVSEITFYIKKNLEALFPFMQIQGEISNFKKQSSGHLYFSLKDSHAQISCVMFYGKTRSLARLPKEGDKVIIKGGISVYPPRGNYQILVNEIQFTGIGELLIALEQLKKNLKSQGYFDAAHKKPLPRFPKTIGVITSPTGAAIQDILNVLQRRHEGFHLILNPVRVQGEGAAEEIAQAIKDMNHYHLCDVMIVGRGGGSIEDLWAFNEEIVAKAIFSSKIPIISAVGHETDQTLSDLVADVRAPTPSAAAEIVLREKMQLLDFIQLCEKSMYKHLKHQIETYRHKLEVFSRQPLLNSSALTFSFSQKIDMGQQELDLLMGEKIKELTQTLKEKKQHILALNPLMRCHNLSQRLHNLSQRIQDSFLAHCQTKKSSLKNLSLSLQKSLEYHYQSKKKIFFAKISLRDLYQITQKHIQSKRQGLKYLSEQIQAVNPQHILNKGYHILFSQKDGKVILSSNDLQKGDEILIQSCRGKAQATINKVHSND